MKTNKELELPDVPEYDEIAKLLIKNYLGDVHFFERAGLPGLSERISDLKQKTKNAILTKTRSGLTFHGGCLGCIEQDLNTCLECMYFDFSRNFGAAGMLPNMFRENKAPIKTKKIKTSVIKIMINSLRRL